MAGEVTKKKDESFAVLTQDASQVQEIIRENIGDGGISQFDLDRLRVPAGGGLQWEVPTLRGEKTEESVDGIIIFWADKRAYWRDKFGEGEGNAPPDCSSEDSRVGSGDPGGQCIECPYGQWKSGEGGRGQACKQMRLLFILRRTGFLPMVLVAPPTSLQPVRHYFLSLAGEPVAYHKVVTRFSLERATNVGGIKFAKIKPEFVRKVSEEEGAKIDGIRQSLAPGLKTVSVSEFTEEARGED